jgi:hypothetical protein
MNVIEKFQKRVLELCNDDKELANLAQKYSELEMDFEFVRSMNTELSMKYQELMDTFPTSQELECLLNIVELEDNKAKKKVTELNKLYLRNLKLRNERITKLRKFLSALISLEAQDPLAKPISYDELVGKNEN